MQHVSFMDVSSDALENAHVPFQFVNSTPRFGQMVIMVQVAELNLSE